MKDRTIKDAHIWALNLKARFKEWRNAEKPDSEQNQVQQAPFQLVINAPKES